ncbi:hypothetical protein TanjilG_06906 [Lupinus angustifolius]|uniref:ENT domain-containing protein n=1 Tax=Lupinus angustifolius TaxID=3871 RepID=A0A4P1QV57_LUPAN|nr:hypothetical protein TanjilG_06906 [Lupinus angustifolius]
MAYQGPDSGAGHDYLPSRQTTFLRSGSSAGNSRSTEASEAASLIRQAEKEAYSSVLRAFKYRTDDLSWEKQELMIDLRKELKISYDEHKEIVRETNTDETLNSIRNWRRTRSYQPAGCSTSQPVRDVLPIPTDSTPRKRPKTTNLYSSAGPSREHHVRDCNLYSSLPSKAPAQAEELDRLIGRKAMIRWPSDEQFYEVTITEYDPSQGMHKLVYDNNEVNETFEWSDINQIPREDIQWIGEDPGTDLRVGHSGREGDNTVGAERRVHFNLEANEEFPLQQNVIGNRVEHDLVLLNTDVLIKEVEDIIVVSSPNSLELESAKQKLKEHEQDLLRALALLKKLSDAPDRESGML